MLKAEKVLADCKKAVELMEAEENPDSFRVLWVACLALLRSVGHVLKKVDGKSSPEMGQLIAKHYDYLQSQKSSPNIFWDFIEVERNILLKEYEIGFLAGDIAVATEPNGETFIIGDHLFCPMVTGPFEGMDCRDLINEAIEWWGIQFSWVNENKP